MDDIKKINPLMHIGIIAMFLLPIIPSNLKSIVIALFGVIVLLVSIRRKISFDTKFFVLNSAVFFITALTMFYSDDAKLGIHKLLQFASLIVFPFIFALTNQEERQAFFRNTDIYFWVFLIAVFLFNVVAFVWYYFTRFPFDELLTHFHTLIRIQSGKFNIHPIYLSMHCGIGILFSLYLLRKKLSKLKFIAIIVMNITLIAFLFLYAKKGPIIAILLIITLFTLFQQNKKYVKPYLFVVICLIGFTIALPNTRNKFMELIKIEALDQGNLTSTNIRYSIYQSAQDLIAASPVVGYGVGDYKNELNAIYIRKGESFLAKNSYNSHNQFYSLMLIGGAFLLLSFISVIALNLIYAIRFDNQILILLLVFYGIVMFTENILEREQGVIFFSFFFNFFTLKSLFVREQAR